MVEHAAPGRVGQPDARARGGRHHAHRHAADGARRLDVQHRGRAGAPALDHSRARTRRRVGAPAESGSVSEFLAMGGYGFYVWGSYGVAVLCIAIEIWSLRR